MIFNSQVGKALDKKVMESNIQFKIESDNKIYKAKVKQLEKSLDFIKQNDHKGNYLILKEFESVKALFAKL